MDASTVQEVRQVRYRWFDLRGNGEPVYWRPHSPRPSACPLWNNRQVGDYIQASGGALLQQLPQQSMSAGVLPSALVPTGTTSTRYTYSLTVTSLLYAIVFPLSGSIPYSILPITYYSTTSPTILPTILLTPKGVLVVLPNTVRCGLWSSGSHYQQQTHALLRKDKCP